MTHIGHHKVCTSHCFHDKTILKVHAGFLGRSSDHGTCVDTDVQHEVSPDQDEQDVRAHGAVPGARTSLPTKRCDHVCLLNFETLGVLVEISIWPTKGIKFFVCLKEEGGAWPLPTTSVPPLTRRGFSSLHLLPL